MMPATLRLGCSGAASEMQNHADQRHMEIGFRLGHAGIDALPPWEEPYHDDRRHGAHGDRVWRRARWNLDTVLTTRLFPDQAACFPRSSLRLNVWCDHFTCFFLLNAVPPQALAIDFGRHALPRTLLRTASTQLKHRALAKSSNFQPSSNRCPSDPRIMKRATWRPISDADIWSSRTAPCALHCEQQPPRRANSPFGVCRDHSRAGRGLVSCFQELQPR